MKRNEIIRLEDADDFKEYRPIMELMEDVYLDNQFYVLNTNEGNIAFSYNVRGVAPSAVIHNQIVFLGFGTSYYIIDLLKREILYKCCNEWSVIFDIVKCDLKSCVVVVGELALICFNLAGQLRWENCYIDIICDWIITEEKISVVFDNGKKWSISLENGKVVR